MLIKPHMICVIPTLIMGSLISISSSSWLLAWLGLEVNLMSFIPILLFKLTPSLTETTIKYFLVQTLGSMIIIMSLILSMVKGMNQIMQLYIVEMMFLSLALKSGVAPLHSWFPQVSKNLKWIQFSILLTWQKLAPIVLMSFNKSTSMLFLIMFTSLTGAISGLNQMNIKMILVYSSIMNLSWMMMAIMSYETIWWLFFTSYCLILLSMIMCLYMMNISSINNSMMNKTPTYLKFIILMNIFSMAGMPPFLGFFMKIIVLESMMTHWLKYSLLILVVLISSVISFYFYMFLTYSLLLQNNKSIKLMMKPNLSKPNMNFMLINFSLMVNILIPAMILMI